MALGGYYKMRRETLNNLYWIHACVFFLVSIVASILVVLNIYYSFRHILKQFRGSYTIERNGLKSQIWFRPSLPSNFDIYLQELYINASSSGFLKSEILQDWKSSTTTFPFQFYCSYANMTKKGKSITITNFEGSHGNSISSIDPLNLENVPSHLIVGRPSRTHTIIFNKYNHFPNHLLLVTNELIPQQTPLLHQDFESFYKTLTSLKNGGVGFFNSDYYSGATQQHKHLQVLPFSSFLGPFPLVEMTHWAGTTSFSPLPIDGFIQTKINAQLWKPIGPLKISYKDRKIFPTTLSSSSSSSSSTSLPSSVSFSPVSSSMVKILGGTNQIYTLPQFSFLHALALLPPRANYFSDKQYILQLFFIYIKLLTRIGICLTPNAEQFHPSTYSSPYSTSSASSSSSSSSSSSPSLSPTPYPSSSSLKYSYLPCHVRKNLFPEKTYSSNFHLNLYKPTSLDKFTQYKSHDSTTPPLSSFSSSTSPSSSSSSTFSTSPSTTSSTSSTSSSPLKFFSSVNGDDIYSDRLDEPLEDYRERMVEGNTSFSYNLIMTKSWMMVVKRKQRFTKHEFFGAMGLSYVGFMIGRKVEAVDYFSQVGPLEILKEVSEQ